MKIELFKVLNSYGVLNSLFKEKLRGSLAFKILGLLKEVENEIRKYEEVRSKILTDNDIKPDADGNFKIEDEELRNKLNAELTEISNSEVEIHARAITLEELDKIDISPEELLRIEWAIENGDNS